MKEKYLYEIADVIAGQSPPSSTYNKNGEGLPFFQGKADFQDKYPKVRNWCNSLKRKVAVEKDILMSVRAPVGVVNICDQQSIIGRGISAIRVYNDYHYEYIYYFLKHNELKIESLGTGATFKAITQDTLKKIKVLIPYKNNMPDLKAQFIIAELLKKVENLVLIRRENITKLDVLIKSSFIQIFGDPLKNEKSWDSVPIGDLVDEVKYGTSASAKGNKYKYLRMNNIDNNGYWDFSDLKRIDVNKKDYEKYVVKRGDLVFNRTNSKEIVGKTAVFDHDEAMIMAGYLIRVKTNSENNPWYIWGYLNSYVGKTKLFNLCRSIVGMANINAQELQKIKVHKTPLELQNKFEKIVKRVLKLKEKYQQNLTELENLYGALSQKAFKGELDLTKITPLADIESEDILEPTVYSSKPVVDAKPEPIAYQPNNVVETPQEPNISFENFLEQNKGNVFTATTLWSQIKELEGAPEDFSFFKTWVINSFKDKNLKQVYHEFKEKDEAGKDQLNRRIAIEVVEDAP